MCVQQDYVGRLKAAAVNDHFALVLLLLMQWKILHKIIQLLNTSLRLTINVFVEPCEILLNRRTVNLQHTRQLYTGYCSCIYHYIKANVNHAHTVM